MVGIELKSSVIFAEIVEDDRSHRDWSQLFQPNIVDYMYKK